MIEVKMARSLGRDGVDGVRWVLIDPMEALAGAAEAPAAGAAPASAAQPPGAAAGEARPERVTEGAAARGAAAPAGAGFELRAPPPHQMLMLGALKFGVLALALAAAMLTAWRWIGPPRWPGGGAAPGQPAVTLPTTVPQPAPAPMPAASVPTLTALSLSAEASR